MPSPEKTARIYEICAEHGLDYFNDPWAKQTIEYMLEEEFPDEVDLDFDSDSESSQDETQNEDMRTWRVIDREEEDNDAEEDSSAGYWIIGSGILIFLTIVFWEYIVQILLILGAAIIGIVYLIATALAGGSSGSARSSSSSSYKLPDNVTYGLQRASGAVWITIAQGPENWMIDKLEQNRAKDNARYRVVKLVNGKSSGTTYS